MFQQYDKDIKFLKSQVLRFNLIFSGYVQVSNYRGAIVSTSSLNHYHDAILGSLPIQ